LRKDNYDIRAAVKGKKKNTLILEQLSGTSTC